MNAALDDIPKLVEALEWARRAYQVLEGKWSERKIVLHDAPDLVKGAQPQ